MNTPEREELPELPDSVNLGEEHRCSIYGYTEEMMRAYGRLCREDGRRVVVDDAMVDRATSALRRCYRVDRISTLDVLNGTGMNHNGRLIRAILVAALEVDRG